MVFGRLERSALLAAVPKAVSNLTAVEVEATAVRLQWGRPADYKAYYSYLVVARQAITVVQNYSTANETVTFRSLTPGESYEFDAFTVVEGVKSQGQSIASGTSEARPCSPRDPRSGEASEPLRLHFSTEPAPATNVTVTGSTRNLFVSWSAAAGQVGSYTVLLYRDNRQEASHMNLDNRTVNAVFTNRKPGVSYCVVVVSKTRSFETNSSEVCGATGELQLRHD